MQRLVGYLYQANPAGGLAEAFPAGTLRSDLPDWVRVDDGAFTDVDETPAAPTQWDGAEDTDDDEGGAGDEIGDDQDEDLEIDEDTEPEVDPEPVKTGRRRSVK